MAIGKKLNDTTLLISDNKGVLCKRGYRFDKSKLKEKKLKNIKSLLTVMPKKLFNDGKNKIKTFGVFFENDEYIYVPKYFAEDKLKIKPDNSKLSPGKKITLDSKIILRDYQEPIVDLIQKSFENKGGGILSLPCGRGKTIIAIDNIVKLGVKTLVVVHKEFLMNQWIRQIKKLTNARVGIIQRDKIFVKDKDIVICMLKSLTVRDYDPKLFEDFGLVVVDECHHIAAEVYSRALPTVSCKYTLGLSATPKRADGLSKIFHWYLGPMIYKEDLKVVDNVKAKLYKFNTEHAGFKQIYNWKTKEPMVETMINNIVKIKERNRLTSLLMNERRRTGVYSKILVLSRRRKHLYRLKKMIDNSVKSDKKIYNNLKNVLKLLTTIREQFKESKPCKLLEKNDDNDERLDKLNKEITQLEALVEKYEKFAYHKTDYYVGGMKEVQLDKAEEADVIFGTFDMAQEALDIPNLNTIFLTTPRSNVIQAVGRILRCVNYEISPEIYDIVDQLKTFIKKGEQRENYYKSAGYNIYYNDVSFVKDEIDPNHISYDIKLTKFVNSSDALKMSKQKTYNKTNATVIDANGLVSDTEYF